MVILNHITLYYVVKNNSCHPSKNAFICGPSKISVKGFLHYMVKQQKKRKHHEPHTQKLSITDYVYRSYHLGTLKALAQIIENEY